MVLSKQTIEISSVLRKLALMLTVIASVCMFVYAFFIVEIADSGIFNVIVVLPVLFLVVLISLVLNLRCLINIYRSKKKVFIPAFVLFISIVLAVFLPWSNINRHVNLALHRDEFMKYVERFPQDSKDNEAHNAYFIESSTDDSMRFVKKVYYAKCEGNVYAVFLTWGYLPSYGHGFLYSTSGDLRQGSDINIGDTSLNVDFEIDNDWYFVSVIRM